MFCHWQCHKYVNACLSCGTSKDPIHEQEVMGQMFYFLTNSFPRLNKPHHVFFLTQKKQYTEYCQ